MENTTYSVNTLPCGAATGKQEAGSGGQAAPPMPTLPPLLPHMVLDSGFWFCPPNPGLPSKALAVPEILYQALLAGSRAGRRTGSRLFSSS